MENNVRLVYKGRVKKIQQAVCKANEILGDPEFYGLVRSYHRYGEELSPDAIATLMEQANHKIDIHVSYMMTLHPTVTTSSSRIEISYWYLAGELALTVNTLIHETVKAMNYLYIATNSEKRNQKIESKVTPWIIAAIAEIMVNK